MAGRIRRERRPDILGFGFLLIARDQDVTALRYGGDALRYGGDALRYGGDALRYGGLRYGGLRYGGLRYGGVIEPTRQAQHALKHALLSRSSTRSCLAAGLSLSVKVWRREGLAQTFTHHGGSRCFSVYSRNARTLSPLSERSCCLARRRSRSAIAAGRRIVRLVLAGFSSMQPLYN
jgi:hypothetical protein